MRKQPGGKLDVFMVNADTWGLQLAIRTGSAGFSEHVLARTWVQQGYHSRDGLLRRNGEIIPVPEETDLWALPNMAKTSFTYLGS